MFSFRQQHINGTFLLGIIFVLRLYNQSNYLFIVNGLLD